ncbi:MAG TPA: hypothetical protein VLT59_01530, partial [Steroidobacteraceae bacterium]|nr:hypothetical protein [Steroidobacteraceae bacterium]
VTAAGASLTADVLEGQSLVDDPLVRAAFALEPIDLREVLPEAGIAVPATNDATALTRFAMQTRLEATGSTVRLSDLDLGLDDTQVSGSLEVAFRDPAAVRFSLHADRLDADRYLPPGQAGASTGEDSELPLERLRTLPVTGVLTIATATMAGTEVRDLRLELGSAAAGLELEHGGAPSMGPTTAARATVDPSEDREGRFRR